MDAAARGEDSPKKRRSKKGGKRSKKGTLKQKRRSARESFAARHAAVQRDLKDVIAAQLKAEKGKDKNKISNALTDPVHRSVFFWTGKNVKAQKTVAQVLATGDKDLSEREVENNVEDAMRQTYEGHRARFGTVLRGATAAGTFKLLSPYIAAAGASIGIPDVVSLGAGAAFLFDSFQNFRFDELNRLGQLIGSEELEELKPWDIGKTFDDHAFPAFKEAWRAGAKGAQNAVNVFHDHSVHKRDGRADHERAFLAHYGLPENSFEQPGGGHARRVFWAMDENLTDRRLLTTYIKEIDEGLRTGEASVHYAVWAGALRRAQGMVRPDAVTTGESEPVQNMRILRAHFQDRLEQQNENARVFAGAGVASIGAWAAGLLVSAETAVATVGTVTLRNRLIDVVLGATTVANPALRVAIGGALAVGTFVASEQGNRFLTDLYNEFTGQDASASTEGSGEGSTVATVEASQLLAAGQEDATEEERRRRAA